MSICHSCLSNSGEKRISPAQAIHEGAFWIVEHAYPSGLLGWMVIVLKRHCEKLHELEMDEWKELAEIEYKLIKTMHAAIESKKEYVACFAEMEGFQHIHFHIIPKTNSYDEAFKGTKAFQYLKPEHDACISAESIREFCKEMRARYLMST